MSWARNSTTLPSPAEERAVRVLNFSPVLAVLLCCVCVALPLGAHPGMHATLDYLSALIAESPDSQLLYHRRGIALLRDGQYQSALSDLQTAATLGDPRPIDFHLGLVHIRMMNYKAARACLDAYLEYAPAHIGALRQRAELRKITGDPAGALDDFLAVLALHRQAIPADYLSAAELMVTLPQYGTGKAIAVLDQGMNELGALPHLQQRVIALELQRGNYGRAEARMQSMSVKGLDNPFWQVEMARLLLEAGKPDRAYRHLATAEKQLSELRRTRARVQLSDEVQALLAQEMAY